MGQTLLSGNLILVSVLFLQLVSFTSAFYNPECSSETPSFFCPDPEVLKYVHERDEGKVAGVNRDIRRTLDLGCNEFIRNPFKADDLYGVDFKGNKELNISSWDANVDFLPFPDNFFDYVTAYDFLEHVLRILYLPTSQNNPKPYLVRYPFVELMNEIHRVLKPNGFFSSCTPMYPEAAAFSDPTHVNYLDQSTFLNYFDTEKRWGSLYGFTAEGFNFRPAVKIESHLHLTGEAIKSSKCLAEIFAS